MLRLQYWTRLLSAFLSRFKKLIFLSTLIGVLFFILFPRIQGLLPWASRGEVVGLVGRYSLEEMPLPVQSEISTGLTTLDEEFAIKPGLAVDWKSEEDGKVWIFELGDYRWQDGKPVRAEDINYNFEDVEREVLDDKRIKFILKDPFTPFPSVVSRPVFKRGLLGAGEWKVIKLSLINNHFIEELKLRHTKDGRIKTYRFYPTEEAARTSFKLGETQRLEEIVDLAELAGWKNIVIREDVREDRYAGVFFNLNNETLAAKKLRQALAYAIDKERLGSMRAISPISPTSWAFNPQVKPYTYDRERAGGLLKELEGGGGNITVNLVTTPTLLPLADKIKEDWEAIGINTQTQVANTPPPDFQALIAIQAIPSDPDQYSLWHSKQAATNITNYGEQQEEEKPKESQRIDKLLEDGRRTPDKEERKKIYIDFQRFLVEDSPVIFLYHPSTYNIVRK